MSQRETDEAEEMRSKVSGKKAKKEFLLFKICVLGW
jgi:hypothetical protein